MPREELLVGSYVHLANLPRPDEALRTLKKVASMVMPIIRKHGWKVRELGEIYPKDKSLLGFNQNKSKICLRLRYPSDEKQFLPIQQVTDTMLHELSHMVHSHHHSKFHALWNQLRDEYLDLTIKGYTGEGFLSDGNRLGGSKLPRHERSRLVREAAEKRRLEMAGTGPGQRLGGSAPSPDRDMRRVIAAAVDRRNKTLKGCGMERLSDNQIRDIADSSTLNGFRTQAEEDEANEAAIAQAIWELAQQQEEEEADFGYLDMSAPDSSNTHGAQSKNPETVGDSSSARDAPPSLKQTWECVRRNEASKQRAGQGGHVGQFFEAPAEAHRSNEEPAPKKRPEYIVDGRGTSAKAVELRALRRGDGGAVVDDLFELLSDER